MKKQLCGAMLCLTGYVSHAQSAIPAKTIQLGGSVGYYQRHNENSALNSSIEDYYSFTINPQVGYFVAPNWVVGLGLGYGASKTSYATAGTPYFYTQHAKSYQLGPFVQYYRMLTERLGLTGTLAAAYTHSSSDYQNLSSYGLYTNAGTSNGLLASLTPGLVYLPVERLALGASVGSLAYSYGRGSQRGSDGLTNDSTSSSFSASFGLSYLALSGTYYFRQ